MAKLVGNRNMGLLRSVEERVLSKKVKDERKKQEVPYLPKDCISSILIELPFESLQTSRFVCKPWYNIINSPNFIGAHLRRSESVLIFLKSASEEISDPYSMIPIPTRKPNAFSVEASFLQRKPVSIFGQPIVNSTSKFWIQFMEFKEGKFTIGEYNVSCQGKLRAACNGLVLLDNVLKKGGLIVGNPVTRKVTALPVGTLCRPRNESYGLAFSDVTGDYKVVHLFRDELRYVSCEIINLGKRQWREINGPSFGLFGRLGHRPVSAIGALHWMPQIDPSNYIVSLEVDNEKFHTIPLPKNCDSHDRIIEMGGFLCFVTHEELNIDIWNLKNVCGGVWTKQHRITKGIIIDMAALFSLRISGEVIFQRSEDGSFYVYDPKLQLMREVEMNEHFPLFGSYLPHVSSFVSWTRSEDGGKYGMNDF